MPDPAADLDSSQQEMKAKLSVPTGVAAVAVYGAVDRLQRLGIEAAIVVVSRLVELLARPVQRMGFEGYA